MKIQASPSRPPQARPLQANTPPATRPTYNHLPEDTVRIQSPLGAAVGAAVGVTAGVALAQVHPLLGLATGLAATGLGLYIGGNYQQWDYSLRAKGLQLQNRLDQSVAEWKKGSPESSFAPLGQRHQIAARSTGVGQRGYDGYDSSRDIAALYAREGSPEQAYAIEVELAHLRPAAEEGFLDTSFKLDWGQPEPLTIVIDRDQLEPPIQAHHNPLHKRLQVRLEKALLREHGWTDGTPLKIEAQTRGEGTQSHGTSLGGRSDTPREPGSIFRWEGKTVYYAVTDRFANGDKSNDHGIDPNDPQRFHGGDWQGVIDNLDYLKSLNVDCIWLSCPYEAQRDFLGMDGFHGYWPMDFRQAEPNFGDREKLRELTQKAREKGMKVMLDVVLNHTGYGHPYTTDPGKKDWFNANGNISGLGQWAMENQALCGLPDLAQDNPEVERYLIEVHQDWLQDVDAFRLDALRHMPETFLRKFDQSMKEVKPDYFAVGETFWLEPNFVAGYQNRTTDSMFDFPLAYAIRRTFAGDESRSLQDRIDLWKEVKPHASQHEAWRMLLDSHKSQSMKLLSEALANDRLYDNPGRLGTFIDNHDMVRFMTDTGGDLRRQEQALAFLFGVRGTPHIYYGTEVAMEGLGPANRNDMEWGKNPEFTERFRQLSQLRSSSDALQYGSQVELHYDEHTYAFARVRAEEEVLCLFNKNDQPETLRIPLHAGSQIPQDGQLQDMLQEGSARIQDGHLQVTLPAKGYQFLRWTRPED